MPARWALVHPGILVRQPYTDDDIDVPKAVASKVRLDEIYPLRPVACAAAVTETVRRAHGPNWPDLIT